MAQRKRKRHRMAGNEKRMNPADSAGTDGAIEGQSPAENSTNTASHATRVAKQAKQKRESCRETAPEALLQTGYIRCVWSVVSTQSVKAFTSQYG